MDSKANTSAIPDLNQRYMQRQTVPIEDDLDSPPPYTESSAHGATNAASSTTPTCPARPSPTDSNTSSFDGSESRHLMDTTAATTHDGYEPRRAIADQYRAPHPMATTGDSEDPADKWEAMKDTPGCCFSTSGGFIFSDHDACFFSDHDAVCFSDNGGCCFSDNDGCCFSDSGGCCFSSNGACCFSHGPENYTNRE